jgi:hypothetical protein
MSDVSKNTGDEYLKLGAPLIRSSQKFMQKYFANKILVSLAKPCAKFLVIYD